MFVLEKTHPIKICVSSERERRGEERETRTSISIDIIICWTRTLVYIV